MHKRPINPTLLGALLGIWFAASTELLAWFNNGRDQAFHDATNFVSNLPRLLFIKQLGISRLFEAEVLFIYCALIGAIFAWLKSKDRPLPWVFLGIFFIILVAGHWYALLAPSHGPISW